MQIKISTFFIFTFICSALWAQNSIHILVEEMRIKEGFPITTPSVSVIESHDIDKKQTSTIADALKQIPGLFVAENGGTGQPTSVFIRGAESRHTLVLIDNIEVNDPLNPSRGFDFATLSTDHIERIEIYRGAQSVKFGSDAIGGVINIITKKGSGPFSGFSLIEYGSYNTLKSTVSVLGKNNHFNYSLNASLLTTSGFSAADKNAGNSEADSSKRIAIGAKLGWSLDSISTLDFLFSGTTQQTDLDLFGGPSGDDPNSTSDTGQIQTGLVYKSRAFTESLSYSLGLTYAFNARSNNNPSDALQSTQSSDYFQARNTKLQFRGEYIFTDEHSLQFGSEIKTESGFSDSVLNSVASRLAEQSQTDFGTYASYYFQTKNWLIETGLRSDVRNQFGNIINHNLNISYEALSKKTILHFNYGTGFKTPSLYQIYSTYGNKNLIDEKSTTVELSAEQKWTTDFFTALTFFSNTYYNLIDYDTTTLKYFNIAKSSASGIELQSEIKFNTDWSTKLSLTHLSTKNEITGRKLLRRPENLLIVNLNHQYQKLESAIEYTYVNKKEDSNPVSFIQESAPDYDLINFKFSYASNKKTSYYGRISNLLNKKYQSVAGYGTAELSLTLGLRQVF